VSIAWIEPGRNRLGQFVENSVATLQYQPYTSPCRIKTAQLYQLGQSQPNRECEANADHKKSSPGQKGAKRLLDQYGAKLLCVRYLCDGEKRKRFKTIELIIEESPWAPHERISSDTVVGVRI